LLTPAVATQLFYIRPPGAASARQVPALRFLADVPPGMSLFGLARLQAELEDIVGARVDLVPAADLKPDVRERAGRDLVAL
jgi:hypothetical protein